MKSRGLGDTVEKIATAIGADRVARAFGKKTGKDCGCNKRRDNLNRIFPYDR
tara:strand:+ start:919 stop:1074 length:156 start_codon:yes stop_codon:yes gene_type:complete